MLQRKVQRVLSQQHTHDSDLISTLQHLSTFYHENTLENRRNLRTELEMKSSELNIDFLNSFEEIVHNFTILENNINSLSNECLEIGKFLSNTKDSTKQLITITNNLRNEQSLITQKQLILTQFLSKFSLTNNEQLILKTTINKKTINFEMFSIVSKIIRIINDCKMHLLLNNHSYNERASLDIFDRFTKLLENAHENIYKWVQKQSRNLGIDVDPLYMYIEERNFKERKQKQLQLKENDIKQEINVDDENMLNLELYAYALYELRSRSGYFEHCCQELSSARRLYWVQRFINALTKGEKEPNSEHTKPIEKSAYDSVRYLSDMLAWIHNAVIQEKEFALFIFQIPSKLKAKQLQFEFDNNTLDLQSYSVKHLTTYLDRVLQGLFRPLRNRFLGILNKNIEQKNRIYGKSNAFDIVTGYRLCHVLDFYVITLSNLFTFKELPMVNEKVHQNTLNFEEEEENKNEIEEDIETPLKFLNYLQDLRSTAYDKFYHMVRYQMDCYLDTYGSSTKNYGLMASIASTATSATDILLSTTISKGIAINSDDLSVAKVFSNHLERLNDIMQIYSTSLVPNSLRMSDFNTVLTSFIDPMLQVITKSIETLDMNCKCVYLINVLNAIIDTLDTQQFTMHSVRYETISLLVAEQKEILIQFEASLTLQKCKVFHILQKLQNLDLEEERMCDVNGLGMDLMFVGMKSLCDYIFSIDALSLVIVEKLNDIQLKAEIRNGVAIVIFDAFSQLYEILVDEKNGYYLNCKTLLEQHSVQQVRQVLQIK